MNSPPKNDPHPPRRRAWLRLLPEILPLLFDLINDPRGGLLSKIVGRALKPLPKHDPDEPTPPPWLRRIEFGVMIIGPAIFFGLAFAFWDFIEQFSAYRHEQELAEQRVQHDTMAAFNWRLIIGAVVGAALGAVYVVRCIIRKVDP